MLKRSKMAPMTVEGRAGWGPSASAEDKAVIAALEQLPRIEHLTLSFPRGWPKLKEISSILSGAAPLLHTFQIHSDDSQTMIPETIFSGPGGAPQLRRLSLAGCSVSWESEFLRSLTHLTVVQVPTARRLSVNDLITNLGHMPQLESIHLSSVLAPLEHSELNASSCPSTLLPSITRLHLEESLMSCLAFFTNFTYPNTAIVSIQCSGSAYHTDNVMPSVRDLITTINAKNIVPITSLYVNNLYNGTFRAQDSQEINRVFVEFRSVLLQPSSISWDSLSLHHLKSLHVVGIMIQRSVWLGVFGKLKKLETIVIRYHANELLGALSRGISRGLAGADATVTSTPRKLKFSALKSLSLRGMDEHCGERPWVETLPLCFRERRRRGLTLRRLCIEGHGGGADVVCQVRPLIKHVKWTEVYGDTGGNIG